MDKQFEKVIEKLESLSSSAAETKENLEKVFQKVKNAQKDTDNKLSEIKNELNIAIGTFKKESEDQLKSYTKDIQQIKDSGSSELNELTKLSEKIKDSYESNVGRLIKDIDNKATEILEIHKELDKIKIIQKSAEESFLKNSKIQEIAIEEFKEEANKVVANMDLSNLDSKFNSLKKRISKLEKHAHKHTFGGVKV